MEFILIITRVTESMKMKTRLKSLKIAKFLVVTLLQLTILSSLSMAASGFTISLPSRVFQPEPNAELWLENHQDERNLSVIIQLEKHLDLGEREELAFRGVHLYQYLNGNAWLASVEPEVEYSTVSSFGIRWIDELLPEDKISSKLLSFDTPKWSGTVDGELFMAVSFSKAVHENESELLLHAFNLVVGDYLPSFNTYYISTESSNKTSLIDQLSNRNEVVWIDYIAIPLTEENEQVRSVLGVDELYELPYNLDGSGVTVCVYDGGLVDNTHSDFGDRVRIGETGEVSSHATHVAGTVGGAGDDEHRGVAPGANIVSYYYEACSPYCLYNSPQDIFENYLESHIIDSTFIFTNSIGSNIVPNNYDCDWLGDYELTSALLDSIVVGGIGENGVTVLFAAGNERSQISPCGNGYSTLGVPASAKNTIVIGATDDNDNIASFSSWGPTDDGRVKPDVVAPGVNVLSTFPGNSYSTLDGTSMSTPAVSGVVALMIEAWMRHDDYQIPLPSTIKALLCNSALDLGQPGPDYVFGFGRVDAVEAINAVDKYAFLEDVINDDDNITFDLMVPPGQADLKVTLAWSDPPATPLSEVTLINDLDLMLISPSGTEYLPLTLNPNEPDLPAIEQQNHRDVVEQVVVIDPEEGEWSIVVDGGNVPEGPQKFSIAASEPLQNNIVTITGIVTDFNSDEPLSGAAIKVGEAFSSVYSDTNGRYTLYYKNSSDTELTCSAYGYVDRRAYLISTQVEELVEIDFPMNNSGFSTVVGTVTYGDGSPVEEGVITNLSMPSLFTVSGIDGGYSIDLPANTLHVLLASDQGASPLTDQEALFVLADSIYYIDFVLLEIEDHVTGPDNFGYIAVESSDDHSLAPEYDWIGISDSEGGQGSLVPIEHEEHPIVVSLPFEFTYYGTIYSDITINENGFFCFGDLSYLPDSEAAQFGNTAIPNFGGPPAMVAPFWEDFRAEESEIFYWYDSSNGKFIIEWYDCRQFPTDGTRETFEVILYDETVYSTFSGNGLILFQYNDVNDYGNATAGIESPDQDDGIEMMYFGIAGDGSFAPSVNELQDGTAILFANPSAGVNGTITLVPESGSDIFLKLDQNPAITTQSGPFLYEYITPGVHQIEVYTPGYERKTVGFELEPGELLINLDVELWELMPPRNLVVSEIDIDEHLLTWQRPDIEASSSLSFLDTYRVYSNGIMIAEVNDTLYTNDQANNIDEFIYWVTALYSGGESDTSNHSDINSTLFAASDRLLPEKFSVSQPYPNPFNPVTTVNVSLPVSELVTIKIYDILGREVAKLAHGQRYQAGIQKFSWNATGHSSGVYFVRVDSGKNKALRKLVLLK
jgi:Subtilase family/Secretion system C-terminal sorting domain/CarboxypepD_reg-like domain